MRIETWNLKKGDPITVYDNSSNVEYIATVLIEPWEKDGHLLIKFIGRRLVGRRLSAQKFSWSARYDEGKNIWFIC